MHRILVLNGPNLNLLGSREPGHYGTQTLADIEAELKESAQKINAELDFFQSNAEYQLIEKIHLAASNGTDFIIINPAAFTHTSVAIRDALLGIALPFIEIHLSNVFAREEFRHHSYLSDIAVGVISGLGSYGYQLAFEAAIQQLNAQNN